MGIDKCNKNGIRDRIQYENHYLKMISRINRTSKTIITKEGIKTLYTCYNYRTHSTLFRYASSYEEAVDKFKKYFNITDVAVTVPKYPALDVLLNNNYIITN